MPLVNKGNASYLVSYNGFSFNPNTTHTNRISSEPVYDSAGRTITHMRYTLEIHSIIYGRTTDIQGPEGQYRTDDQLNEIRKKLQSPGGTLVYQDRGFGECIVNGGGRQRDVHFGPKPKVLTWEPWGDANACEITWQVEWHLPECDAAKFQFALMEFCWRVSFVRDADGYTQRRIAGHASIPLTRITQANRQLKDSIDNYRQKILDLLPQTHRGFRPTLRSWNISEDKRTVEFEFVDDEMRIAPPPGVLKVDATFEVQQMTQIAAAQYLYTLTANYHMVKGAQADIARVHFRKLRDDRERIIREKAAKAGRPIDSILHYNFRARDQIYSKTMECYFQVSFMAIFQKPSGVMTLGLWEEVPESSYDDWKAKVKDVLFGPYGQTGVRFNPEDDVIVDLCSNPRVHRTSTLVGVKKLPGQAESRLRRRPVGWVAYYQAFDLKEHDSTFIAKPLIEDTRSPNDPARKSIVSQRCMPTYYVWHTGYAIRVNAPVAPPRLKKIGTFELTPANREDSEGFHQRVVPGEDGNLIYMAKWRYRYAVPTMVGINGPVPNPTFAEGNTHLTFGNDGVLQAQGRRF